MPRVSVVVPCFNSERYLSEALASVARQTFQDFEVVVVDNNSTDGTVAIARSFADRLTIRVVAAASTQAEAKNIGVEYSRADLVAFIDSDDSWAPDKLRKQVEFMDAHPGIQLCHTYCMVIDRNSTPQYVRHEGRLPGTGDYYQPLLDHCFITVSATMVRRSVFMQDGVLFPTEPRMRAGAGEDLRFFLLVARRGPIGLIDEVLTNYRQSPVGLTNTVGWRGMPEDLATLMRVFSDPSYWKGRISRGEMRKAVCAAAVKNSCYWLGQGFGTRGAWFALRGLGVCPFSLAAWGALFRAFPRCLIAPP